MGRFKAGHTHLRMEPAFDFGRISTFEKGFDGFFQIGCG
jgi:hypothetical protein